MVEEFAEAAEGAANRTRTPERLADARRMIARPT
jgi:hypothetical protein